MSRSGLRRATRVARSFLWLGITALDKGPGQPHNHPEGIRGAQAVALSVYFARRGEKKIAIRQEITSRFGYDLARTADEIRSGYSFDVSCQGSVPESIICFLDSESFESSIRLAISLGGDADTMACITGAISEAYYGGVPESLELSVRNFLAPDLLDILDRFRCRYCTRRSNQAD